MSTTANVLITTTMTRDLHDAATAVGLNPESRVDMRALTTPRGTLARVELRRRVARLLRDKGYSLTEIGAILGYIEHSAVHNLLKTPGRDALKRDRP